MICENCGLDVSRTMIVYRNGERIEGCRYCIHLDTRESNKIVDHITGTMSVAHRADIKRRKRDPISGEVYRDVGRRYFT